MVDKKDNNKKLEKESMSVVEIGLYDVNVVLCSMIIIILILIFFGGNLEDKLIGLIIIGFVWLFQVQSIINPQYFYYMWNGWFNVIRMALALLFIPGLMYLLKESQDEPYKLMSLIVLIMSIMPGFVIPYLVDMCEGIWENMSVHFNIPKRPSYMWRDIVIPSTIMGVCLIVIGRYV